MRWLRGFTGCTKMLSKEIDKLENLGFVASEILEAFKIANDVIDAQRILREMADEQIEVNENYKKGDMR